MQTNNSIEQILSDLNIMEEALKEMKKALWKPSPDKLQESEKLQEIIIAYLLANCGFIEYCLNKVYSETTEEQRASYERHDRRTDSSAVGDNFKNIALVAIKTVKHYWNPHYPSSAVNPDNLHIDPDDLHMLSRGLIMATHHISSDLKPRRIFFHPIEEHMQNLGS